MPQAVTLYDEFGQPIFGANALNVTVNASDIQIGAIEVKDATTDTRAKVGENGLEVEVKGNSAANPLYIVVVGSINGGGF